MVLLDYIRKLKEFLNPTQFSEKFFGYTEQEIMALDNYQTFMDFKYSLENYLDHSKSKIDSKTKNLVELCDKELDRLRKQYPKIKQHPFYRE